MKKTYYFSHDFGARNDPKLVCLRTELGLEAIGAFWCLIETLFEQGGSIPENSVIPLLISLGMEKANAEQMLSKCLTNATFRLKKPKTGLSKAEKRLFSDSVTKRLEKIQRISLVRKKAAESRLNLAKPEANAKHLIRKRKENKINNINNIMKIFYDSVNKGLNFQNLTQRDATQWLINTYGDEEAVKTAETACSIQGQPFSPVITTPLDLKNKIGALSLFLKRNEETKSKENEGLDVCFRRVL